VGSQAFRVVSVAGVAVILSGCVSPMISIPDVTVTVPTAHKDTPIAALDQSVAQAEGLRRAYTDAAANISTARELSALTILGLGAAALGIVVTHGGGQFPIGAAIGGATLLGAGTRTLTTAQQNIYFAGAQALTCALQSQIPVLVLAASYSTLRADVLELDRAISAFAALGPTGDDAALLTAATATDIKAHGLLGNMETAGFALEQQTNAIKIAVDKQTAQSEPDLQSITGVVSGLPATAGGLVAGVPGLTGGGARPPAGKQAGTFNNLPAARAQLNAALAALQPLLSQADSVALASTVLGACAPSAAAQVQQAAQQAVVQIQQAGQQVAATVAAAANGGGGAPPPKLLNQNSPLQNPTQPPKKGDLSEDQMKSQDKSSLSLINDPINAGRFDMPALRKLLGFKSDDATAIITPGVATGKMRVQLANFHTCIVKDSGQQKKNNLQPANPNGWLYNSFFSILASTIGASLQPDTANWLKPCLPPGAFVNPPG
jgi:type II secretory pathway pseudopilin PulG